MDPKLGNLNKAGGAAKEKEKKQKKKKKKRKRKRKHNILLQYKTTINHLVSKSRICYPKKYLWHISYFKLVVF